MKLKTSFVIFFFLILFSSPYLSFSSKKIKVYKTDSDIVLDGVLDEKFWLEFERKTDDFDAGIGRSKFIFGNGKYKNFIGTQCIYAVKILDDSAFSKHKCKLNY